MEHVNADACRMSAERNFKLDSGQQALGGAQRRPPDLSEAAWCPGQRLNLSPVVRPTCCHCHSHLCRMILLWMFLQLPPFCNFAAPLQDNMALRPQLGCAQQWLPAVPDLAAAELQLPAAQQAHMWLEKKEALSHWLTCNISQFRLLE